MPTNFGLESIETGTLDRPLLPMGMLLAPSRAEIQDDRVVYQGQWKNVMPDDRLLERFVALADGPPERICAFATSCGTLQLCWEGLPAGHDSTCREFVEGDEINNWRRYAREASLILQIANALRAGRMQRDLWEEFLTTRVRPLTTSEPDWPTTWKQLQRQMTKWGDGLAREILAHTVTQWIDWGHLRLGLDWTRSDPPTVHLGSSSLIGTIGIQLAWVIAGTDRLAVCSSCGEPFVPKGRQPRRDRRAYCAACRGAKRPLAVAKRNYRMRKRARDLRRRGLSEARIAKDMKTDVATVRDLLGPVRAVGKG